MTGRAKLAWGFIVLLALLHFDLWYWDDDRLILGFIPIALAFHAFISIAAAGAWLLVVLWDWPEDLEDWANAGETSAGEGTGHAGR